MGKQVLARVGLAALLVPAVFGLKSEVNAGVEVVGNKCVLVDGKQVGWAPPTAAFRGLDRFSGEHRPPYGRTCQVQ